MGQALFIKFKSRMSLFFGGGFVAIALIATSSWAFAQTTRPAAAEWYDPIRYPAVSGINVFGGPSAGANQNTAFGGADLNIAVPLGREFGAQFGGNPEFINNRFAGSAEGHFFWRDPSIGMLGLYGSYTGWNGWGGSDLPIPYTSVLDLHSNFFRGGVEAEYYSGRWTVSAVGGWKSSGRSQVFFDSRLSYYITDFAKLYVGYEFTDKWLADQRFALFDTNGALVNYGIYQSPNLSIAKIGAEAMLPFDASSPLNGASMYAEVQGGEHGYVSGMAGLRFRSKDPSRISRMGSKTVIDTDTKPSADPGKSLIQRDRMDYVLTWLPKDPQKGKYEKRPTYAQAPPAPPAPPPPPPPPVCTPAGGACNIANPAACCSLTCAGPIGGPFACL